MTDSEMGDTTNGAVPVSHAADDNALRRRANSAGIIIRLVSGVLCAVALITMVTDKQVKKLAFPTVPPIYIVKSAHYKDVKALEFYSYATGVVSAYLLLHAVYLVFASFSSGTSRLRLWVTLILDQLMLYLLIATAGAATEVAYLAEKGAGKVAWEPVCNLFSKFCHQVGISIVCCFLAILPLMALVVLSAYQLFALDGRTPPVDRDDYKKSTTIA